MAMPPDTMMTRLMLIAVGGAAGSLSRYLLSGFVQRFLGADFPWGTWAVNVLGSFLFGLVWILSEERYILSSSARIMLLVGFMGAFTTFSTYVFESANLAESGNWLALAANIAGQNVLGILCFYAGVVLGRVI